MQMHCRRLHVVSALGLALWACALSLTHAQPGYERAIDAYLQQQVEETTIPGMVALVVDDDSVLYEGAFGERNAAAGQAMTTDSIFQIMSMTKPLATTVIMMLVDEGKLSLDDFVADYIPGLAQRSVIENIDIVTGDFEARPAVGEITIRQLLSHSSGLVYPVFDDMISAIPDPEDARYPLDNMLLHDPGTDWSYAGGIHIVGRIAERIEGAGLDTLMRERLFEPLGMHDTSFIVRASDVNRVVTLHRLREDGSLIEVPNGVDVRAAVSGDGGLHTTAADYAKFIRLFLNDGVAPGGQRLLSASALNELTRNQLGSMTVRLMDAPNQLFSREFPLGAGRDGFGLGFQVTGAHDDVEMRPPGSLSWAGLNNTEFWIDREHGIGGILLMQYLPFYHPDAIATLQEFEALVYRGL